METMFWTKAKSAATVLARAAATTKGRALIALVVVALAGCSSSGAAQSPKDSAGEKPPARERPVKAPPPPKDSGREEPSEEEDRYLRAKVAGIADSWVRADADGFLRYWHPSTQLSTDELLAEIEELREAHRNERGYKATDFAFLKKMEIIPVPGAAPRLKDSPLRSDANRNHIGKDLKTFFAGLNAKELLAVESVGRNSIGSLPEAPPPKEKVVPGEWVVRVAVSEAAQARGFDESVTFVFDYLDGDWYLTGMLSGL